MKERPILYSAPMVRALLAGTKTQTRRVVKPRPMPDVEFVREHEPEVYGPGAFCAFRQDGRVLMHQRMAPCPYGQPGDRLVVRETWQYYDWSEDGEPCIRFQADNATSWPSTPEQWADRLTDIWETLSREANYSIDNRARDRRWRPSIHMPRWASRLTLEITGVRVERLQDISAADAIAEGLDFVPDGAAAHGIKGLATSWSNDPRKSYRALWESINGPGSWDANPWVWVVGMTPWLTADRTARSQHRSRNQEALSGGAEAGHAAEIADKW